MRGGEGAAFLAIQLKSFLAFRYVRQRRKNYGAGKEEFN